MFCNHSRNIGVVTACNFEANQQTLAIPHLSFSVPVHILSHMIMSTPLSAMIFIYRLELTVDHFIYESLTFLALVIPDVLSFTARVCAPERQNKRLGRLLF